MTLLGGYVPGESPVHRAPAGAKLLVLLSAVTAILAVRDLRLLAGAVLLAVALYAVAGLGPRHVWRTVRPLLIFLAVLVLFQGLVSGIEVAARVCAQLSAMVLLGGLLMLTTRVSAMLALFERLLRPLARVGVDPQRAALVLALTMRAIPLAAEAWRRSREAYLARGLRRHPHRLVVPVIVSLIRSAEAMGEALVARGLE